MIHTKGRPLWVQIHTALSTAEAKAWSSISTESNSWKSSLANILLNNELSTVVTLNYDTLLERLMISKGLGTLLYPAPLQRLNTAWNQLELVSHEYTPTDIFLKGRGWLTPNLFKLHGSLSWYTLVALDPSSIIYSMDMNLQYINNHTPPRLLEFGTLRSMIVPPVADKSSLYENKVLRSQWIGAMESLQKCDELYCVGYSFPKSDYAMMMFLTEVCVNIRQIYLVTKCSEEELNELEKRLQWILQPYTKISAITGDNCVEQMANKLINQYSDATLPQY